MPAIYDPRIEISVGTGMTESNSHGAVWVRTTENDKPRVKRVFFQLNKPQCVRSGLSYITWSRIIKQLRKMGFDPTHLEFDVNGKQYCYLADSYREIYAGATGRAIAHAGVA